MEAVSVISHVKTTQETRSSHWAKLGQLNINNKCNGLRLIKYA